MRPIWTYHTRHNLSADYRRALKVLYEQSSHWQGRQLSNRITESCWDQGAVTSFSKKIAAKEIPSGISWRWNQTRCRIQLTNEDESAISISKLRPRRRRVTSRSPDFSSLDGPVPSFKLWVFELVQPNFPDFTVLWCESGWTLEGSASSPGGPLCSIFPLPESLPGCGPLEGPDLNEILFSSSEPHSYSIDWPLPEVSSSFNFSLS